MTNYAYTESIHRGRREHGEKWDTAALDATPQFVPYFGTGQRIRVTRTYDSGETHTRTGLVGRTTGWRPAFLLMHRSNAHGSWDLLGPDDIITAKQVGGRYIPVYQAPAIREDEARKRLEYLRGELRGERISYGELAELQGLARYIEDGDTELLFAAGVPEFPDTTDQETGS